MLNMMRRSARILAVLAVPFLAAASSDDDDDNITNPPNPGIAQVRVVHRSPDAPAVDVAVNGEVAVQGAAYLDATSVRAASAAPYPAPSGGVARVAYVSTLTPAEPASGPGVAVVGLAAVVLVSLAILAWRRVSG